MTILYAILIALLFSILGWLFTTEKYITFLHTINPIYGLLISYTIFYIIIFTLHFFGLNIGQQSHIDVHIKTIATLLILFSFFLILGWESEYMCKKINKDCGPKQSEDAAVFHMWYSLTGQFELSRILTYVITPFVLVLTGILLILRNKHIKNINIR